MEAAHAETLQDPLQVLPRGPAAYFLGLLRGYEPLLRRVCRTWRVQAQLPLEKSSEEPWELFLTRRGEADLIRWYFGEQYPDLRDDPEASLDLGGCPQEAARIGDVPVLEALWPWSAPDFFPLDEVIEEATSHGHIPVLEWVRERHALSLDEVIEEAASHGHIPVLEWARERYVLSLEAELGEPIESPSGRITRMALKPAASNGHQECVDAILGNYMDAYLEEWGWVLDDYSSRFPLTHVVGAALVGAARIGHCGIIDSLMVWATDHDLLEGIARDGERALEEAAAYGRTDATISLLVDWGVPGWVQAFKVAAACYNLRTMRAVWREARGSGLCSDLDPLAVLIKAGWADAKAQALLEMWEARDSGLCSNQGPLVVLIKAGYPHEAAQFLLEMWEKNGEERPLEQQWEY